MDPVTNTTKIIELTLSVLDKLADKLPDFDQRLKKDVKELRARYEAEKKALVRDLDLILDLKDEIELLLETWNKELDK